MTSASPLHVRLVTTWGVPCGIAEHSFYLREAVAVADPSITITPDPESLDPAVFFIREYWPHVLHLNYHSALHSRWDPVAVRRVKNRGARIVITFHDTIGEISPEELRAKGDDRLDRLEALATLADAIIVHEPCKGLPAWADVRYWRMGVPAWESQTDFGWGGGIGFKRWRDQPVLGSIGFPFPWKNYDQLASETAQLGWALLLIAPGATTQQVACWEKRNPNVLVRTDFVARREAISLLAGCDATAFPYTCANTAQSAAILQGIAARKPVIATAHCRQFRALFNDRLGRTAITWLESLDDLAFTLSHFVRIERTCPAIVALAEQDSWEKLGRKYADLYRALVP